MQYLEGQHVSIDSDSLKAIIGKKITYLRSQDIDKTGRGYFFPRVGSITAVKNRRIYMGDHENYISLSDLKEVVLS